MAIIHNNKAIRNKPNNQSTESFKQVLRQQMGMIEEMLKIPHDEVENGITQAVNTSINQPIIQSTRQTINQSFIKSVRQ